jgi:kynurenine formamidase
MKYFDLTHLFTQDMLVYPGDPKPELKQTASVILDGYNDFSVMTSMHVGTHMDAYGPGRHPYLIHQVLIKNDILIIENLTNLDSLKGYPEIMVTVLPLKIDSDPAPVRVIAQVG